MSHFKYLHIHLTGLCVATLLLGGAYVLGIRPFLNKRGMLQEVKSEASRLNELLPKLEEENRKLQVLCSNIPLDSIQLPPEERKPILNVVSDLLNARQVGLLNFTERTEPDGGAARIEMTVRGAYHEIAHLVQDIVDLNRPAKILKFDLSANDPRGEACQALLHVRFAGSLEKKAKA